MTVQGESLAGICWSCGSGIEALNYGRADSCLKCGKDTRVCKNCVHYDANYNNACKENQADRVVEKERACFCDYFRPGSPKGGRDPQKDALKAAAEALFKK